MKKQILALLCSVCILLLSSCSEAEVHNGIDASFLNSMEKEGETYIQSQYGFIYSIDFENKTYALEDGSETSSSWFEEDNPDAFEIRLHPGGGYIYTIPEGYRDAISYVEGCKLESDRSVIAACGYAKDGILTGFIQVYKDTRTIYANYAIEEIDHSLIFTYDAENDKFTVTHKLDGVVIVAANEDIVICWKDRAYYKYDLKAQAETYLIEDQAYDAGLSQLSSSGVYSDSEICVLHMSKRTMSGSGDVDYMYVYNWSNGDFFELMQE